MDHEVSRPKSWQTIRSERALNDRGVTVYKRLMEAEDRLDEVRRRRGVSDTALGDALAISERENEDDVYVSTLVRYVAELGGYLEVRARFRDETITLLMEPSAR
jgi:hypothetical protein